MRLVNMLYRNWTAGHATISIQTQGTFEPSIDRNAIGLVVNDFTW